MIYLDHGRFIIQLINNYGDEAVYLPFPLPARVSGNVNPLDISLSDGPDDMKLGVDDNRGYFYTFLKTLTHTDIITNALVSTAYVIRKRVLEFYFYELHSLNK